MTRRPEQLIEPFAAPPAPLIELLNSYDELDLEKLDGADLAVFLEWPGIALGDTFLVHWRGADAQGRAFDIEGIEEDVNVSNFDPQTNRVLIQITNDFIVAADQGYAFVSYELTKPALGPSLRRFMFVGVRVDRMEHMPVAQAVESHDLCIDPSALGTNGVTFVIPPYQAMHAGDDVKLTFQGFSEDLGAEPPWTDREPVLVDADIGLPVIRRVPSDQFYFLQDGDYAEVHYEVTLAAGGKSLAAPLQRFRIGKLPNDRLPQLAIDNYDGGELNPIDFPYGLTLRVAAYPQLNVSDWVLLHVNGQPAAGFARTDLSTLASAEVTFQVGQQMLKASPRLTLSYQSAREGLGLASQTLEVELVDFRELGVAEVEQAIPEGGEKPDSAWLGADKATTGAYVNVPPVDLREGEAVEVHWLGRPGAGTHVATQPVSAAWPWRFRVPASAVAANMEPDDASTGKRFEVLWHIVKGQQPVQVSPAVNLRILPLGTSSYPQITCDQAQGQWLSRSKALQEGAHLTLRRWLFMATGQQLKITFIGKGSSGALVRSLRNGPTTPAETEAGRIALEIPKDVLSAQTLGETFEIRVSVNFENVDERDVITTFSPLVLGMAQ